MLADRGFLSEYVLTEVCVKGFVHMTSSTLEEADPVLQ